MGMDYFVYLKNIDGFSTQTFEQYCDSLGLHIKLHPSFDILKDTGFYPMCLVDERFAKVGKYHEFLSGFEVYTSEYNHIIQPHKKTKCFFGKFFKSKPKQESPFDTAVKEATLSIALCCSSGDSFEVLLAYIFGAYLVKYCGGVFDDPQTGQYYNDNNHIENEIDAIITDLLEQSNSSELITHEFNGWL